MTALSETFLKYLTRSTLGLAFIFFLSITMSHEFLPNPCSPTGTTNVVGKSRSHSSNELIQELLIGLQLQLQKAESIMTSTADQDGVELNEVVTTDDVGDEGKLLVAQGTEI